MHSCMERIRKWAQSLTQRQKLIILRVVMAAAAALIVFGAARMFWLQKQYADADREYAKVQELAGVTDPSGDNDLESVGTVSSSSSGSAAALLPGELPTVALDKLQKENPDTVGWLYAPALGINYPIMQDTDNTYYIKHTFSGGRNDSGSIFLDAEAAADFSDKNTYIFGHNMRNGSMFGSLKKVRETGLVSENPYFWIYREDGWHMYQIFSYHNANADRKDMAFQTSFENDQAYQQFLTYLQEQSEEDLHVALDVNDKIVSLSTCTGDSAVRLVVHGKLVDV